jgi:hypothetical protein
MGNQEQKEPGRTPGTQLGIQAEVTANPWAGETWIFARDTKELV